MPSFFWRVSPRLAISFLNLFHLVSPFHLQYLCLSVPSSHFARLARSAPKPYRSRLQLMSKYYRCHSKPHNCRTDRQISPFLPVPSQSSLIF
ncbi:hypothetical protein GQ607_000720 [Colletotrichum asianum]|uniref:Uncharacterized protein n=1 Tax=Colletotrichum asianum TaxID=702518 RepID=A0A8H3WT40_9PEZI|nr:hypothetical protein GQ607_000720 [Colletotrichum asianum]